MGANSLYKRSLRRYRILFILGVFGLSLPSQKGFSQNFEGIIQYQIPELKKEIGTDKLDYMIKGHMLRIEYKTGDLQSTSVLYEAKNKSMFIKMSMLGGHVEVPPDDVKENIGNKEVDFKKTGTTKTVAGKSCELLETTFEGTTYLYCFASGMGNFILPLNSITAGSVPDWAGLNFPDNQMPLEVIRVKGGKNKETVMKAIQINQISLDKNLFSVFNR